MSKNILILSGLKLHPSMTGGHLHTTGIGRALARAGHEVRLYSIAGRQEDYRFSPAHWMDRQEVEIEPRFVEEVDLRLDYGLLQSACRRLGRPRRWQYRLLTRGHVPARLKRALNAADRVFCDLPYTPPVPGPWSAKPFYLISHNLEHELLRQGTPREQAYAPWMEALEASAPARYRDITPCTVAEQNFFRSNDAEGRCRLPIIGSAVDPDNYRVPAGTRERIRAELGVADDETVVVFAGSRFQPNVDALATLKQFCREECAFLERHRIRFLALGSVEPQAQREGPFQATGRVPEVAPYFAAADIGLNPVTWGSGANVKVFEYLAVRLPVLTTRVGARGTELVDGVDCIEYDVQTLKDALLRCLESDHARRQTAGEAIWQRHRHYCDIITVTQQAVRQLRDFD